MKAKYPEGVVHGFEIRASQSSYAFLFFSMHHTTLQYVGINPLKQFPFAMP
jgi:hypothetical protein